MSDQVEIRFDKDMSDNATLLLAAAEELGLDPHVVATTEGAFLVPQDVYDKAFGEPKKAPAKKTAAKKSN